MASNRRLPESPPVPPPVGQGALQRHSFSARAPLGAGVGERGPEKQEVARDPGPARTSLRRPRLRFTGPALLFF